MTNKPIICVDFDGVLNDYEGWRGPDYMYSPRPGARDFLTQLQSKFTVAIFSTRDPYNLREWFELYHMPYDKIVTKKVPAVAYIDDRALRFDGNYNKLLYELSDFKAHWEKEYDQEGFVHGDIDETKQYNLAYETEKGWWAVECGGLTLWKEEVVYFLNEQNERISELKHEKDMLIMHYNGLNGEYEWLKSGIKSSLQKYITEYTEHAEWAENKGFNVDNFKHTINTLKRIAKELGVEV